MYLATFVGDLEHALMSVGPWVGFALGEFSQTAAGVLVSSIWQGAIVACALAITLKVSPRISAKHRFLLWAGGFVTVACLSLWPLIIRAVGVSGSAALESAGVTARPWIQLDLRWGVAIAGVWLAASLYRAMSLALHTLRLRKVWKSAIPVEAGKRLAELESLSAEFQGRKQVQICTTKMLQRPCVIGFFAPKILIPDWLLDRLTPGELEHIVLHETEHLRRHDDWTNLLQKLSLVVFPLNPALLWMERRLCLEREMACDEGVVRITHAPRAYAACLTSLAERGLERRAEALSLGAWQRRPELVHRVHGILLRKHALNSAATGTLLGAMGCGLIFGSFELARCPQLVAFVAPQRVETAKEIAPVEIQQNHASVVRARFRADERNGGAAGFYAVEAKATMPTVPEARPIATSSADSAKRILKRPAVKSAPRTSGSETAAVETRQELAIAGDGVEEHWVVLTRWQQVQTTNRGGSLTSDYDAGPANDAVHSGNAVKDGNATESAQTRRVVDQVTITQLILKVIPSSSIPTQPATAPLRNGWFVFQL